MMGLLWDLFVKEYGREPNSMEELEAYSELEG
jgi:hypothetical protein